MHCLHCGAPMGGRQRKYCDRRCGDAAYYRRKTACRAAVPQGPVLHHGAFQAYQERYGGLVDVIITDPPYGRDQLPLYEALGQFALTTLVPGGWVLCMVGDVERFAVERAWNALPQWEYVHLIMYRMLGNRGQGTVRTAMGARDFNRFKKAILFYEKRGEKADRRKGGFSDVIDVPLPGKAEMDQDEFKWQQNLLGFQRLVEMVSSPADVLCDPMMGSGTTLLAALALHRPRVIGIEKDAQTFATAQRRLALAGLAPAAEAAD